MENEKNCSSPQTNPAGEPSGEIVDTSNIHDIYEIRVKGCLDRGFWSDWFGFLEFSIDFAHEETLLRGQLADQAELYGLLSRLRNRGLTLVSVQQIQAGAPPHGGQNPTYTRKD